MKVGVCIFDDTDYASAGWASVGGEDAVRIESMSALANDTLWVTNLPFFKFRKLNLTKSPHMFDYQYFRTSLKLFEEEFGIKSDPELLATMMSGIFQRTVMFGEGLINLELKKPDYRYTKSVATKLKRGAFRARPRGTDASVLLDIWEQSTQQNQSMFNVFVPKRSAACSFVIPRGAYFKWLLSQNYPNSTKWEPIKLRTSTDITIGVDDGEKIKGTDKITTKLLEIAETSVGFFRVRVESMDSFFEPFASFGAGTKMMRNYATIPEILRLSEYSKITIMDGYRSDHGPLDIVSGINLNTNEYSISRSLLLENIAAAFGSAGMDDSYLSSINAYLHAYDRLACSYFAEIFAEHNFVVGSYSSGRIMVYVRPGEEEEAAEVALKMGLIPPASLMGEVSKPIKYENLSNAPKELTEKIGNDYMFNVIRTRFSNLEDRNRVIVEMDGVPLMAPEARKSALERIILSSK